MRIIAGEDRGRTIEAPSGKNTRPTLDRVRENLFNMIQSNVADSRVLDLFAGSGALSFESLSRGAQKAVLVDHDKNAASVQRRNCEALGYGDRVTVLHMDWEKALNLLREKQQCFDLIFLDPPYAMAAIEKVFSRLKPVADPDALIVLEHAAAASLLTVPGFDRVKNRNWGYCGVSLYRIISK